MFISHDASVVLITLTEFLDDRTLLDTLSTNSRQDFIKQILKLLLQFESLHLTAIEVESSNAT